MQNIDKSWTERVPPPYKKENAALVEVVQYLSTKLDAAKTAGEANFEKFQCQQTGGNAQVVKNQCIIDEQQKVFEDFTIKLLHISFEKGAQDTPVWLTQPNEHLQGKDPLQDDLKNLGKTGINLHRNATEKQTQDNFSAGNFYKKNMSKFASTIARGYFKSAPESGQVLLKNYVMHVASIGEKQLPFKALSELSQEQNNPLVSPPASQAIRL